jgi:hypothetical protein
MDWIFEMKRIALLVCGLVLVVANSADARWRNRGSNNMTYTRPVAATTNHTAYKPVTEATTPAAANSADGEEAESGSSTEVATASHASASTTSASNVKTVSYSTATAQGVANLMARDGTVRHYGGNPGYEGCGCGATAQAAYSICCYGNSGMATVDVGYARSASGMWFCCRRYR